MLMDEGEVYEGAKLLLRRLGWELLAGQPPGGTNSLPVVEVKPGATGLTGSLGSLKPDLIAYKDKVVLVVEAKPRFDAGDEEKLTALLKSEARISALVSELRQRSLLERRGIEVGDSELRFAGALAHAGDDEPTELSVLLVELDPADSTLQAPAATVSTEGRVRLEDPSLSPWS